MKALENVVTITLPIGPRPLRPPRWRCLRAGLWACWYYGRHYASARLRRGAWYLTIFSPPGTETTWGPYPWLGSIKREMRCELAPVWKMKAPVA